jgi:hypothetical protein
VLLVPQFINCILVQINPKYLSVKHEKVDLKYAIVHILRTLETRVNLKPMPGGGAVNPIFR